MKSDVHHSHKLNVEVVIFRPMCGKKKKKKKKFLTAVRKKNLISVLIMLLDVK